MVCRFLVLFSLVFAFGACTKKSANIENSITAGLRVNLKTLDPAQASEEGSNETIPNIYEGLLQYNYLKRPLTPEPLLADGMPEVSKDGLTHKFKIKSGIKFQDSDVFPEGKGREVVASDFIYSWKRLADPKGKGEGFWIFDGKVKGLNEWRDKVSKGEAKFEDAIEGFSAPDDHTLVIKLSRPYYQLNYVLTMPFASVVPKEAVDKYGEEFMNHPVGTGPYKFESWARGSKLVLVKNPTWHGGNYPAQGEPGDEEKGLLADAGKALPFVDKLVFLELPEDQPRWLNLMRGAIDYTGIPKDSFDKAIVDDELSPEMVKKGFKLDKFTRSDVAFISFNMDDPIIGKKPELRKALSLAYDTETSMKVFYNNQALMAHSPISPDMEGWDPEFKNPYKETNIEKAKEFLKKAGHPEGKGLPELEYNTTGSATARQMAEYTAQQFGKIGIRLKVISNSWPQFQERVRTRKAQMFGMAWNADYPDAENLLQLFYSKNVSPGPNNSNYQNKEFDALYEQAVKLPPGPKRTELYLKMRDIFVRDMPWIPTVHRIGYAVQQGWLKNYKPNETLKGHYKYLRVDLKEKAELLEKF